MDKYLIINADDFGMCSGSVLAVSDLLTDPESALTSSTIMAPCAWAAAACRFAAKHPELAIGVHFTLTNEWGDYRWAPVAAEGTASLRDEEGFMWHTSRDVELHATLEDIDRELRAQIQRCAVLGLKNPSHFDNHMGSLYGIETGRFELVQKTFELCAEYGKPFRFPSTFTDDQYENDTLEIKVDRATIDAIFAQVVGFANQLGVAIPDYLMPNEWGGPQDASYEAFREYILDLYASIPNGVTETYLHPSLDTADLRGATGCWQRRVWEYQIMKDPATKQHIQAHGIQLINYRDLQQMRKA